MPPVPKKLQPIRRLPSQQPSRALVNPQGLVNGRVPSVLSRIEPVGSRTTGIKLLIYGRGKTGKTRLACNFPKPLLLIGTEDGTKTVARVADVDFVKLQTSEELNDLIGAGAVPGKYKTVVLDTAGGYQDLVLKDVLGLEKVPVSKFKEAGKGESWGITGKGTWGTIGTRFKERVVELLNLSETHGLNVVCIAHERNFNEEATTDVMAPYVAAALTPGVAGWMNGVCDYIAQTFLREQVKATTGKVAGRDVTTYSKTGKIEYCLRVGPHPIFYTGFRVPDNEDGTPGVVPDLIVDPSYAKIAQLLGRE